jgi:hypothetical protein
MEQRAKSQRINSDAHNFIKILKYVIDTVFCKTRFWHKLRMNHSSDQVEWLIDLIKL